MNRNIENIEAVANELNQYGNVEKISNRELLISPIDKIFYPLEVCNITDVVMKNSLYIRWTNTNQISIHN